MPGTEGSSSGDCILVRSASLRQLFSRFLPQLIYGASDGIVTTLAVVAGVDLPVSVILILGFANLLADGISMGASAVLTERSKPGLCLDGGRFGRSAPRRSSAFCARLPIGVFDVDQAELPRLLSCR